MSVTLPVAFAAGVVSFFSPCVLPLVPTYLLLLGGGEGRPPANAALFVLGFSLVFIVVGLPFTLLGAWLHAYKVVVARVGGALVFVCGLALLGVDVPVLSRTLRWELRPKGSGPLGALALGVAFAAGWSPCIGPVLGTVLTLAAVEADPGAIALLASYALGLGVPFLVAGLLADRAVAWMRRSARYGTWVQRLAGSVVSLVGVLLLTGVHASLSAMLRDLTPLWLWGRL